MLVSLDPSYKVDSQHWEETGSNASEWAVWCWLLPAALCLSVPCLPAPVHTHPQLACPATCWRCLALQTEDISSLSSSVLCIWSFYVPSQLRAHACLSKTIENFCMVGAKDFFPYAPFKPQVVSFDVEFGQSLCDHRNPLWRVREPRPRGSVLLLCKLYRSYDSFTYPRNHLEKAQTSLTLWQILCDRHPGIIIHRSPWSGICDFNSVLCLQWELKHRTQKKKQWVL